MKIEYNPDSFGKIKTKQNMKELLGGLIQTRHCQAKIVHTNIVADFQTTLIRKQT